MIIFDLDGTLADCEHRRYLVDPLKEHPEYYRKPCKTCKDGSYHSIDTQYHKLTQKAWEPDWQAFYEACDKDKPIQPVIQIFNNFWQNRTGDLDVVIFSGRCESVKEKTYQWIDKHLDCGETYPAIRMRPVGDHTPDHDLKERWLDEALDTHATIDFVVDDRQSVCQMWRRRGIFVFDVSQGKGDF